MKGMQRAVMQWYLQVSDQYEQCFNVLFVRGFSDESCVADVSALQIQQLVAILRGCDSGKKFGKSTFLNNLLQNETIVEIGPRLEVETPWSSKAVDICRACGIDIVERIEISHRYVMTREVTADVYFALHGDRMTQCLYSTPLQSFDTGLKPKQVQVIDLLQGGESLLRKVNKEMGLGLDESDMDYYIDLFVNQFMRNPTDVELFHLAQANSEHCRHGFFRGKMVFDGIAMPQTLFEIVKKSYYVNTNNSVIAFHDNASALEGFCIPMLVAKTPGQYSELAVNQQGQSHHITFTAETHNHPTGIAPYPGAQTGSGGRYRDNQAVGRGGLLIAGTAGYCVGQLHIPEYEMSWESSAFLYPSHMASPLDILIQASNGASDYGNEFGEPVISGFTRSFGACLPNKSRCEWIKPIMFTGGLGQIYAGHIHKETPFQGDIVVMIGGPAYRIGVGGGAASSMTSGTNDASLDFASVQRGNPEMANRVNRVIRACIEMSDKNPIKSIHDQGAGGVANVVTELVSPEGAHINLNRINIGDATLSVLEIWIAEYQERLALLIDAKHILMFEKICQREKVPCEILGEVTGSGRIVVDTSFTSTSLLLESETPVNLDLKPILEDLPQKTFRFNRTNNILTKGVVYPSGIRLKEALEKVLRLLDVGSKRFLVTKVDRSVTGLVMQQQCCGPVQLPVADCGVVAQSYFASTGAVTAIGERPMLALINPASGARMSVAEMLLNMAGVLLPNIESIKCSVNEMWPAKMEGEGPKMWDALEGLTNLMIDLGIACDGGKDSLSMVATVADEKVKAPGQIVVSGYAPVSDVTKKVTPDIKYPGQSILWFIDVSQGKCRMGGSALARVYSALGDEAPNIDTPDRLKNTFMALQEMVRLGIIQAYHDKSDGGLITTLLEMAFSGNCGLEIDIQSLCRNDSDTIIEVLFNEEAGVVVEVLPQDKAMFFKIADAFFIRDSVHCIGRGVSPSHSIAIISQEGVFSESMQVMRQCWEETSYQIMMARAQKEGLNEGCVRVEQEQIFAQLSPYYICHYIPQHAKKGEGDVYRPKLAVIREEGVNGDRELAAAFLATGFRVYDVTMTDLLNDVVDVNDFQMIAFAGGFSYGDVTGSAHGWASVILQHPKLAESFERFRKRSDTLSFGVCNGCQLMAQLGWVVDEATPREYWPRFVKNTSGRFESRWVTVAIHSSKAVMCKGMSGWRLGVWIAHGEGKLVIPDYKVANVPISYVNDTTRENYTEVYPFNPNGSSQGATALCSPDGRHLAMMPHAERAFQMRQWPYVPQDMKGMEISPWMQMFHNASEWCRNQMMAEEVYRR